MASKEAPQSNFIPHEPVPAAFRRFSIGCCAGLVALPFLWLLLVIININLPADLSPQKAHYETEKWVGREVRVTGWLRQFEGSTGLHYAVEDEQQNRVGVRNYAPELLQPLLGRRVILEGKFQFDQQYGIYVIARLLKAA